MATVTGIVRYPTLDTPQGKPISQVFEDVVAKTQDEDWIILRDPMRHARECLNKLARMSESLYGEAIVAQQEGVGVIAAPNGFVRFTDALGAEDNSACIDFRDLDTVRITNSPRGATLSLTVPQEGKIQIYPIPSNEGVGATYDFTGTVLSDPEMVSLLDSTRTGFESSGFLVIDPRDLDTILPWAYQRRNIVFRFVSLPAVAATHEATRLQEEWADALENYLVARVLSRSREQLDRQISVEAEARWTMLRDQVKSRETAKRMSVSGKLRMRAA